MPYERRTDIDAKSVRVDLLLGHPDFIPFHESSFVLSLEKHVVARRKLQRRGRPAH